MKTGFLSFPKLAALAGSVTLLFACHLSPVERDGNLFSFPNLADSLAGADFATIILKDTDGVVLDTLFHGPVTADTRFKGLEASGYQGGLIVISIEGTKAGKVIYKEDRRYDGDKEDLISTHPVVLPNASIKIQGGNPKLAQGESLPLPPATIKPANLVNQALEWTSRNAAVFTVTSTQLIGTGPGSAFLIAALQSDTSKKDSILVEVIGSMEPVQGVTVGPNPLNLYAKGESRMLTATIAPSTLSGRFLWRSSSPAVASVDETGKVKPGLAGTAFVTVLAHADSSKRDSALVVVKQDTPRLNPGKDTVIPAGAMVAFHPEVTQDHGLVTQFKWDLDADGVFEDSASEVRKDLTRRYDSAKVYPVRFYVRDTEGNDTTAIRRITAVRGPVIQFHSPEDGSSVNKSPVSVTWSVDGARQTASEPLTEGKNVITRTAEDAAGNDYSSNLTVYLDTQAPVVRIAAPEKGLVTRQNAVTVVWAVDGKSESAIMPLAGRQGTVSIIREAVDAAGNRGADTVSIIRDTIPPARITFGGSTSPAVVNAAHTAPVQWAWTRTGEPADSFLVSLNGAAAVKQAVTTFVLSNPGNQSYTLQVQEVDVAGNVSAAVSYTVLVDRVAPPAPVVTGTTPTGSPAWDWSAGPGSDGARVFRYRLAPATAYSAEGPSSSYSPAGLASGTHTLFVQERDAAGNWSTDGSHSILMDRTGPVLTISGPSEMGRVANFNPVVTGAVDDAHLVRRIEYRLNTGGYLTAERTGSNWSFTASYIAGANVVWIRGEDTFGNRDSIRINIHKYPQVVFVRKGATGTGKSWEDAYGELHYALAGTHSYTAGTQIWVTKGYYQTLPAIGDRFVVPWSNFGILGGFDDEKPSVDTTGRDFTYAATALGSRIYIEKPETYVHTVKIDGLSFVKNGFGYLGVESRSVDQGIEIKNVKVRGLLDDNGILNLNSRENRLENCEFQGNDFSNGVGVTLGPNSKIVNSSFIDNSSTGYYAPILFYGFLEVRGGFYKGNHGSDVSILAHFALSEGDILDLDNAMFQGGAAAIHRGNPPVGTLFYGLGNRDN